MAKQIIVNSENKTIELNVQARSNIQLEVSRSISKSGIIALTAGNNIQIANAQGNVTIATTSNISVTGDITANAFYGNLIGNFVGNLVISTKKHKPTVWDIPEYHNGRVYKVENNRIFKSKVYVKKGDRYNGEFILVK